MFKRAFLPVLMVAMLALSACGGSDTAKGVDALNGKWQADVKEILAYQGITDAATAEATTAMLGEALSAMTIEFDTKASTLSIAAGPHKETEKYTVASQKDNAFTLEAKGDKIVFTLAKGSDKQDVLIMSMEGASKQESVVFIRAK